MYKIGLSIIIAAIVLTEAAPGQYVAEGNAHIGGNVSIVLLQN